MEKKIPAVSVIIPMYNAEKFIAACLESIFAQNFKDYEVIVVDNCSTDNSVSVVENYLKRGGGRLKLLKSKKNSGTPCNPRNKGLNFSCGKYIYFMDADDLLMKNTLESLYNFAENYKADVVSMHKFFYFNVDVEEPFPKTLEIKTPFHGKPLQKPEIESDDIAVRILDFLNFKIWVAPWVSFSRRKLLIEKEIYFPEMKHCEDDFWTMHLMCEAKKILCIPQPFYIYRNLPNSFTHGVINSTSDQINYSVTSIIKGVDFLCKLKDKIKFLNDNPQHWYLLVNFYVNRFFVEIFNSCINLKPNEIFQIVFEEFIDRLGERTDLVAALCTMINTQQKQLYLANQRISELEKKLSAV